MAEQRSMDERIQAAFADLGESQNRIFNQEHARWQEVGIDRHYYLDQASNALVEVVERKRLQDTIADFHQALERMRDDREWRDVEQSPAYQAWDRERTMPIHEPAAEELGWQAEQRFYAEQDPDGEWDREEQAFDAEQEGRASGEPLSMEERADFGDETGRSLPYDGIVVDTSNPQMEDDFQSLLARLDQHLEAMEVPPERAKDRTQGMEY